MFPYDLQKGTRFYLMQYALEHYNYAIIIMVSMSKFARTVARINIQEFQWMENFRDRNDYRAWGISVSEIT